jgi:hypothetical protein
MDDGYREDAHRHMDGDGHGHMEGDEDGVVGDDSEQYGIMLQPSYVSPTTLPLSYGAKPARSVTLSSGVTAAIAERIKFRQSIADVAYRWPFSR